VLLLEGKTSTQDACAARVFPEDAIMTNPIPLTAEDKRRMIALLEIELGVIEAGGYGRSPRERYTVPDPWKLKSMFQYSVACINHWSDPDHPPESCEGCILLHFVPDEYKVSEVPCHYIPLNEARETVSLLEQTENQERLEQAVAKWCRTTIERLRTELKQEEAGVPADSDLVGVHY
jgi:hypothetical protein